MKYRIDEQEEILYLDLNSGVTAEKAIGQIQSLLRERSVLRSWDWIIEAHVLPSDLNVDHLAELSQAYRVSEAHAAEAQAVVAMVSHDRYLHLWAQVMDFQFPGRRHKVVPDLATARGLIARERAQRR